MCLERAFLVGVRSGGSPVLLRLRFSREAGYTEGVLAAVAHRSPTGGRQPFGVAAEEKGRGKLQQGHAR